MTLGAGWYISWFTNELYTTGIMPGGVNWLDCGAVIVIKNAYANARALASFFTLQIAESTGFSSVLIGPLNTPEV